jgi:hypothetical protein
MEKVYKNDTSNLARLFYTNSSKPVLDVQESQYKQNTGHKYT